jgi:hypothetical protein
MSAFFDPFRPWGSWPWPRGEPAAEAAWLDTWEAATTWWTEPARGTGRELAEANARLLAELADGLMRRFEGRRIELLLGRGPVTGVLESIRLRRTADRYTGRLELSDAVWDGLAMEVVSATAGAVGIESGAPPRLAMTDAELAGRSPVAALVAWIAPRVAGWTLGVDADGRVEAHGRRPGLTLVVEPDVVEHELRLELRALRWHGLRLQVPSWLRLVRTTPLPPLPHRARVVDARRRGDAIDFRLVVGSLQAAFDPARLRDAVFKGGPVALR